MAVATYQSDKEWISAVNQGNTAAFEALVRRYTHELLEHALKRLRNFADAEDTVQDVFADLWEKRRNIQINTSLDGYLHTALKYRVLRRIARADIHREALEHLLRRMNGMQASILDVLAARDLETTLVEIVHNLPTNMQQIFILRQENFTLREIAEALNLAEQTVKNYHTETIHRIRTTLTKKHPDVSRFFVAALTYLLTKS